MCQLWALHVVTKRQFFTFIAINNRKCCQMVHSELIIASCEISVSANKRGSRFRNLFAGHVISHTHRQLRGV